MDGFDTVVDNRYLCMDHIWWHRGMDYGVHGGPTEPWTPIVQTEYQVLCIYSLAEPCKIAPIDCLIKLAHTDMLLMVNLFLQYFIIQLIKKPSSYRELHMIFSTWYTSMQIQSIQIAGSIVDGAQPNGWLREIFGLSTTWIWQCSTVSL